jgi:uncharacterized protein YcfJ
MNKKLTSTISLALAASGLALTAAPASAAEFGVPGHRVNAAAQADTWERHGNNNRHRDRHYARYGNGGGYGYSEPVYRNTRTWRGDDGRYYCRKKDGTTGLIIGGAAGALLGREIDGGRDRTLGTVLGAAAGALLGKEVAQGRSCR